MIPATKLAIRFGQLNGARATAWRTHYEICLRTGWFARRLRIRPFEDLEIPNAWLGRGSGDGSSEWLRSRLECSPNEVDARVRASRERFGQNVISAAVEGARCCSELGSVRLPQNGGREVSLAEAFAPIEAVHWSRIDEFGDPGRDLRLLWEPARFSWTWELARAFESTRDDRYAEAFWSSLELWCRLNPMNFGIHWKCGQEVAIRALSILAVARSFLSARATTPDRLRLLLSVLASSAERIAPTIHYAASQNNNHVISEAIALLVIGALIDRHPAAGEWRRRGGWHLRNALNVQVGADGSYIQESSNYQRLVVDELAVFLWFAGTPAGASLPVTLTESVRACLARLWRYLYDMQDSERGQVPLVGANDGSWFFHPTPCAFDDFRPSLGLACILTDGVRLYEGSGWEHAAVALAPAALERASAMPGEVCRPRRSMPVMRGPKSRAVLKVGRWRGRPNESDLLHLDLWYGPKNIFRDSGSFRYVGPAGMRALFAGTQAHNTLVVEGQEQIPFLGRFLPNAAQQARVLGEPSATGDGHECIVAEHGNYARLSGRPVHRRSILRIGDSYVIHDTLRADATGKAWRTTLSWHLAPEVEAGPPERSEAGRWRIALRTEAAVLDLTILGLGTSSLDVESTFSLYSPAYGQAVLTSCLRVDGIGASPFAIVTVIQPADEPLGVHEIEAGVELCDDRQVPLIRATRDGLRGQAAT